MTYLFNSQINIEESVTRNLQIRLSAMMFIQSCATGTVIPIQGLYFKQYFHYSGNTVGAILAISAASSIIAPLVSAFIADRIISSARVLALCNLVAGSALLALSYQKTFVSAVLLFTIYSLCISPVFSLLNAMTFHNTIDAKKYYTRIRVWATGGWIAVGWIFALIWNNADGSSHLPDALRLGAFISFIMAVYSLSLPRHKIHLPKKATFIPVESLRVFARREVLLLALFTFSITSCGIIHGHSGQVMTTYVTIEAIPVGITLCLFRQPGFFTVWCQ